MRPSAGASSTAPPGETNPAGRICSPPAALDAAWDLLVARDVERSVALLDAAAVLALACAQAGHLAAAEVALRAAVASRRVAALRDAS